MVQRASPGVDQRKLKPSSQVQQPTHLQRLLTAPHTSPDQRSNPQQTRTAGPVSAQRRADRGRGTTRGVDDVRADQPAYLPDSRMFGSLGDQATRLQRLPCQMRAGGHGGRLRNAVDVQLSSVSWCGRHSPSGGGTHVAGYIPRSPAERTLFLVPPAFRAMTWTGVTREPYGVTHGMGHRHWRGVGSAGGP